MEKDGKCLRSVLEISSTVMKIVKLYSLGEGGLTDTREITSTSPDYNSIICCN